MTRMFNPVSVASCSRMCLVGLGVAANAAFSVSSCFALIVVRGPLRFVPGVFSSFPDPVSTELPVPPVPPDTGVDVPPGPLLLIPLLLLFPPMLSDGEDAPHSMSPVPPDMPCPESESEDDAERGEDFDDRTSSEDVFPDPIPIPVPPPLLVLLLLPFDPENRLC